MFINILPRRLNLVVFTRKEPVLNYHYTSLLTSGNIALCLLLQSFILEHTIQHSLFFTSPSLTRLALVHVDAFSTVALFIHTGTAAPG